MHYNTATRTPGGLIGVLPPTDDYGMELDGQEEGSGPGEGTKKGSNTCSCLLPWCGLLLEQNGGGHRIPSGDSVGEGKQWLARLHNKRTNSSIFTSIFETLASPEMARKRQLRLGRWHFYASHLVEGERGEFSLKSDFSADPKFRSRKEIDDNALAPRGDSQVATPSAASRSILFFSSSSSSSSSSLFSKELGEKRRPASM